MMRKKPELLSPAGDMEKLKMAVAYGADAVYLAGTSFGMRSFAGNFSPEELPLAVAYAHDHGVRVHVTVNTMPRSGEVDALPAHLERLNDAGVDALILADLGAFTLAGKYAPRCERHISTQQSIANYACAQAWYDLGAKRVVLARELSMDEIREIRRRAINANLKLIECPIRHLGTEEGYKIYSRLEDHLKEIGVEMKFNTMVNDITIEDGRATAVTLEDGTVYEADEIVSAVGREGADWFSHICNGHGIETEVGTVDIGVRVEVRDEVMEFLNKNLYEAKLVYYTPTFDDKVRTFCTNPSGEVATEYYENGLAVVNGHAYKSQEFKTNNTNFALLVSKNFTKPFKTPIEYGKQIAQLSNMLCDGKILVQTYGDFKRGRRTTEERLCRNNLIPTLKDAVPGDLSLVFPHRIMVDIAEMIEALDKVTPGIASDETLLYGVEVKFYSNKVVVDKDFCTSVKGLRAIGDGASVTRGLQQASANGLSVARSILKSMK